jgi:hypothetical protein
MFETVAIFTAGIACIFLLRTFILGVDPVSARSHSILIVEIGVGITVMAVMVALYYNLSSAGKQDEGL